MYINPYLIWFKSRRYPGILLQRTPRIIIRMGMPQNVGDAGLTGAGRMCSSARRNGGHTGGSGHADYAGGIQFDLAGHVTHALPEKKKKSLIKININSQLKNSQKITSKHVMIRFIFTLDIKEMKETDNLSKKNNKNLAMHFLFVFPLRHLFLRTQISFPT